MEERATGLDLGLSYRAARLALVAAPIFHIIACTNVSQSSPRAAAAIQRAPFGNTPAGEPVELFTLRNPHGIELQITSYGGIITSLKTPDRAGRFADIVLGYDNLEGYLRSSPYFGAIVGRYANRIARGRFTLDGTTYTLAINNGPNSLHGGLRGFDKVVWNAKPFRSEHGEGVALEYTSPDGDEGYPGTLRARVTYT